jgi:hypothetical protein
VCGFNFNQAYSTVVIQVDHVHLLWLVGREKSQNYTGFCGRLPGQQLHKGIFRLENDVGKAESQPGTIPCCKAEVQFAWPVPLPAAVQLPLDKALYLGGS